MMFWIPNKLSLPFVFGDSENPNSKAQLIATNMKFVGLNLTRNSEFFSDKNLLDETL